MIPDRNVLTLNALITFWIVACKSLNLTKNKILAWSTFTSSGWPWDPNIRITPSHRGGWYQPQSWHRKLVLGPLPRSPTRHSQRTSNFPQDLGGLNSTQTLWIRMETSTSWRDWVGCSATLWTFWLTAGAMSYVTSTPILSSKLTIAVAAAYLYVYDR